MDRATAPNTHTAADAALVERARDGDREAFTALVDARLATTYRTALAFLGNEPDARDATEEIFARAWRDLPDAPEPESFAAWFGGIVDDTCRRAALDRRRGGARDISVTEGAATSGTLRSQIIDRVAATKQRSGPKTASTRPTRAPLSRRKRLGIGIPVIGLLGLILVALIAQRLRTPETPFHTGLVAFVRGGDVYLAKPDGTDASVVVHQDGLALSTVVWSPDGRRVAIDGDSGAIVYDTATGVTTYLGGTGPAWSPDGRQVAVADYTDERLRLRLRDLETGATTSYTFDTIGDMAWSPDGRWIVASGMTGDRPSSGDNVLVRLDVSTGEVIDLHPATPARGATRQPAWSPDSFRIAFSRGAEGYRCRDASICDTDVFTADPDGTGVVQLNDDTTSADQPAWSPDGAWVAFRQVAHSAQSTSDGSDDPDAQMGLVIVSPDLTATRTLDARGVQAFAWSPEGDRLRYLRTAGPGRPPSLWEVTVDDEAKAARPVGFSIDPVAPYNQRTGFGAAWQPLARGASMPVVPDAVPSPPAAAATVVAPPSAPPADPSGRWPALAIETTDGCGPPTLVSTVDWSVTPVGKACEGGDGGMQYGWSPTGTLHGTLSSAGELSIVDLAGTEQLKDGPLAGVGGFSWSSTGAWVGISRAGDRIMRPDGSDVRELPGAPNWSPNDGRLWISEADGTLLVGEGDGTSFRAIGRYPGYVVWSWDGSRFAFIRDGDVWTAAADGTDVRDVTHFPLGGAQLMAWSPDGQWLAVAATHGAWTMHPDGIARRGLAFGASPSVNNITWAPDSSRLAIETYTASPSGDTSAVVLLSADGATAVRIEDASGASWSPDGRYLAVNGARPSPGGGYETTNLELMNGDGSGRHEVPMSANGNWPIWVQQDR